MSILLDNPLWVVYHVYIMLIRYVTREEIENGSRKSPLRKDSSLFRDGMRGDFFFFFEIEGDYDYDLIPYEYKERDYKLVVCQDSNPIAGGTSDFHFYDKDDDSDDTHNSAKEVLFSTLPKCQLYKNIGHNLDSDDCSDWALV